MPKNFRAISIRERGKTFLVSPIVVTLHSLKIGRLWEIDNLSLHLYSCWMAVVLKGICGVYDTMFLTTAVVLPFLKRPRRRPHICLLHDLSLDKQLVIARSSMRDEL